MDRESSIAAGDGRATLVGEIASSDQPDDSSDKAPRTPGTTNAPALNWSGYKELMKGYVGLNGASSPQDKLFACPSDAFHYDVAGTLQHAPKSLHEQPPDYLSYAFNGGNARN